MEDNYKLLGLRKRLIDKLRHEGIHNEFVLNAMMEVPRHYFVESAFAEQAYKDKALPIAENQTISQPYTVAYQTQLLDPKQNDKVLEIGLGSGYQCAVLCAMGLNVYSIERNKILFEQAQNVLSKLGYFPHLMCGDGTLGWQEYQPYDGILVTAGSPGIPESLVHQLSYPGGKLIIPIGNRNSQKMVRVERTSAHEYSVREFQDFRFVPLIGQEGWQDL